MKKVFIIKDSRYQIQTDEFICINDRSGSMTFFKNNHIHNDYGPAIVSINGLEIWYKEDKRHRINGPAVIYPGSYEEHWIDGNLISKTYLNKECKFKIKF